MTPPAACPDSFSICAAPEIGLGRALVAVPALGLIAGLAGLAVLGWRMRESIKRNALMGAVALAGSLAAVALHSAYVPNGPVVLYDEFLHSESTANIADRGSGHPCCAYEHGRCVDGGPILWPLATQVASAAMMKLTGAPDGTKARSRFNRFATFLTPLVAFAWSALIVGAAWPAALAAIAIALWPGSIRLESTGDLSPGAMFFLLLACLSVELWRRNPGWAGPMATGGFLVLACHSRMEMSLCVPWVLWRSPGWRGRITTAAAFAISAVPLTWLISEGVSHKTIGWTNDMGATLGFLRAHLFGNIHYFYSMDGASPVMTAAALVGLLARPSRRSAALFVTFAAWIVFDSAYHIGDFRPTGGADGFRYALPIVAMLAPLSADGFAVLIAGSTGGAMALMMAAVIAVPSLSQRSFYSTVGGVARMDDAATGKLHTRQWSDADVLVTRSVAYTYARTRAPNIVERCSLDRANAAMRPGTTAWYLRSWGDGGADRLGEYCPHPATAVPDLQDGLGPWLHEYAKCPEGGVRYP